MQLEGRASLEEHPGEGPGAEREAHGVKMAADSQVEELVCTEKPWGQRTHSSSGDQRVCRTEMGPRMESLGRWEGAEHHRTLRSGNTICEAKYAGTEEVLKWDGHVEIGIEEKKSLKI